MATPPLPMDEAGKGTQLITAPLTNREFIMTTMETFLASALYAGLGIIIFIISFVLVDLLTPGKLWAEIIEKKNTAVATLAGAVAVGISLIIAAAIHG
jgi:putative membrane protein